MMCISPNLPMEEKIGGTPLSCIPMVSLLNTVLRHFFLYRTIACLPPGWMVVSPKRTKQLMEGMARAYEPFRSFMMLRVDPETLQSLSSLREIPQDEDPGASVLIPSFMLSEVERAFQIGFLVFLPFLIIDLVVAAILMSMGMMMVPPAIVSLPFKLAFFVVADGWSLVSGALVRSYF